MKKTILMIFGSSLISLTQVSAQSCEDIFLGALADSLDRYYDYQLVVSTDKLWRSTHDKGIDQNTIKSLRESLQKKKYSIEGDQVSAEVIA